MTKRLVFLATLLPVAAFAQDPSPTPAPPVLLTEQTGENILYCMLFLIGVTLYGIGVSAWGRWHKG